MKAGIKIRKGQIVDLVEVQRLFVDTVHEVCKYDYNQNQLEAWTSGKKNSTNHERWKDILSKQFFLVAQLKQSIVGFATLDRGHLIDFLYTHKDYQRKGVAKKLYTAIENEAKDQGQIVLTSHVSKTARPFFEKVGFEVTKEQKVILRGVQLTNFRMKKSLNSFELRS